MKTVTVAIPTLNGGATLEATLAAIRDQQLPEASSIEMIVCDSGSSDGSVALARAYGAEVIQIPRHEFSHGETRNLLMERSGGDCVAFLTQDAVPLDPLWLGRLLEGFALASDVALTFGPYIPRPDASPMVARELTEWFRAFSPDGQPQIDRLLPGELSVPTRELLGRRGFFTDANGCVARTAWESVRFRQLAYAEDHALAHDMLRAGFAKVFVPAAGVIHSHEYSGWDWLRRSFDEHRALYDVYGWAPSLSPRRIALQVWGLVGADWRWASAASAVAPSPRLLASSSWHHSLRILGAVLGARAHRLPRGAVRSLSLEGRA
jgi:rhamnosyltransferase